MKEERILIPIILLIFLMGAFSSCTNQNHSQTATSAKESSSKAIVLINNPIDTSTQLKFKGMMQSLFEDSKGNFWIGSDWEGVCKYDGKSFVYFTTNDGLSGNQVRNIQEDLDGNIWFDTGTGVSKYDGKTFSFQSAQKPIISANKWAKAETDLWFNGENQGGIYRYDGTELTVLQFPKLDRNHKSFSITGTVTAIAKGQNNMLWMANYGGVIGYDGEEFKYNNVRGLDYHVRSLFEDSKGKLWIGNNGIGVLCYDGNATTNFTEKHKVSESNKQKATPFTSVGCLNHVFAIAEDANGNIWFGDRDSGAWRFDGKILKNYSLEDGLSNMFVRAIYKDKKDNLWLGMEDGGVCKFNGKSFDKMF